MCVPVCKLVIRRRLEHAHLYCVLSSCRHLFCRDDEAIFTCDKVASLSFGAARRFRILHPEGGLAFDEPLYHGDLLIFPRMWEHEVLAGGVPSERKAADTGGNDWDAEGPPPAAAAAAVSQPSIRVNLTFRQV